MTAAVDARAPNRALRHVVDARAEGFVRDLYATYDQANRLYFGSSLGAPMILVTATCARSWADHSHRDVNGLECRIRLAPRTVARGISFARDVLVHEMIHAWANEIAKAPEKGYRGHGPVFAQKANEIGASLGLPPVFPRGRMPEKGEGPDCKHWPLNLRPAGFYPVPFIPPKTPKMPRKGAAPAVPERDDVAGDAGHERDADDPDAGPFGGHALVAKSVVRACRARARRFRDAGNRDAADLLYAAAKLLAEEP